MTQPRGLHRRHRCIAQPAGGLRAGRHCKLQRHGDPSRNPPVMLRRIDGRVLAEDAVVVEQIHEVRLGELGAVV
ncbi:MAG: hypothetical protein ABJ244_15660, partial [Marinobacter sp.]|uniref:hypothetical protein n=1 Tax=Marinobacter sp. TaxID=50741 RepID=UPI00329A087A